MQFAFYRCEFLSPVNHILTKFINRFMELDKFTAMETYTANFWGVTVVIRNVVTTVFRQFALRVFKEL
jgi:hypothetical protein